MPQIPQIPLNPMPQPFTVNPATPAAPPVKQNQPVGPIASATQNDYLKPIASLEAAAEALSLTAHHLADVAAQSHAGYDGAQAAIKSAIGAWHAVGKAADALEHMSAPADPALAQLLAEAQMAVPGIRSSVVGALHELGALHQSLQADQAQKRPDLPPAQSIDPYAAPRGPWVGLAILGGIGYLIWKAVF